MTILTPAVSRTSQVRSSLARRPAYVKVLCGFMVTGFAISATKAVSIFFESVQEPTITKNSFTYHTLDFISFYIYVGLAALFLVLGACIVTVMKDKNEASNLIDSLITFLLCASFVVGFIAPTVAIWHKAQIAADYKWVVLVSTFGKEYETVKSGSETTYVDADGVSYRFASTSAGFSETITLEEVK
jgi:hypothetical protein